MGSAILFSVLRMADKFRLANNIITETIVAAMTTRRSVRQMACTANSLQAPILASGNHSKMVNGTPDTLSEQSITQHDSVLDNVLETGSADGPDDRSDISISRTSSGSNVSHSSKTNRNKRLVPFIISKRSAQPRAAKTNASKSAVDSTAAAAHGNEPLNICDMWQTAFIHMFLVSFSPYFINLRPPANSSNTNGNSSYNNSREEYRVNLANNMASFVKSLPQLNPVDLERELSLDHSSELVESILIAFCVNLSNLDSRTHAHILVAWPRVVNRLILSHIAAGDDHFSTSPIVLPVANKLRSTDQRTVFTNDQTSNLNPSGNSAATLTSNQTSVSKPTIETPIEQSLNSDVALNGEPNDSASDNDVENSNPLKSTISSEVMQERNTEARMNFFKLDPSIKVKIIYALADWQLCECEPIHEAIEQAFKERASAKERLFRAAARFNIKERNFSIRPETAEHLAATENNLLMIQSIGIDRFKRKVYHIGDYPRIYSMDMHANKWSSICSTLNDLIHYAEGLSTTGPEKELKECLVGTLIPRLTVLEQRREKRRIRQEKMRQFMERPIIPRELRRTRTSVSYAEINSDDDASKCESPTSSLQSGRSSKRRMNASDDVSETYFEGTDTMGDSNQDINVEVDDDMNPRSFKDQANTSTESVSMSFGLSPLTGNLFFGKPTNNIGYTSLDSF
ncbi:hypothetical protein O5D80_005209 [Batrachochytrium dendrobatidis]|nr:hypothetical protein O5D80_005209 [Batrachochytrium dendrobatidis]